MNVIPFFLTKISYPHYLKFNGRTQVGISLMPEAVRAWMAPHGSPSDEVLGSLAWAASAGARDPVVRMAVVWNEKQLYPDFLRQCRDRLGSTGWRLTLDILRFSPQTALTISKRYPELAERFARELAPDDARSLHDLALEGRKAKEKKVRPPVERQAEIYRWFRQELDRLGCTGVLVSPCKGDPEELLPLVREGVIEAMPCACYSASSAVTSRADPNEKGRLALPLI